MHDDAPDSDPPTVGVESELSAGRSAMTRGELIVAIGRRSGPT